MGGHYGAIHIRTEDHAAVRTAVEALSAASKLKFYIGPPLRGWIGVYPQKNGHDDKVSVKLAEKLGSDILHLIVHDDSVFYYFYYRDHELRDRYDSRPDYFGESPSDEQLKATAGKPVLFNHLMQGHELLEQLEHLLQRVPVEEEIPFLYVKLLKFAELLDIPNAVSAYEYLKAGETEEIEAWKQFIHIPDPKFEQQEKRSAKAELREKITALRRQSKLFLFASKPARKPHDFPSRPVIVTDPLHNGLLLAWENGGSEPAPLSRLVPPWNEIHPSQIVLPVFNLNLACSKSGRILAVGSAKQNLASVLVKNNWNLALWDLKTEQQIANLTSNNPIFPVALTPDETTLLYLSGNASHLLSTRNGEVLASFDQDLRGHNLLRSDGTLINEANGKVRLIDLASGSLTWKFYLGGKYSMGATMANASEHLMKQIEEQLRKEVPPEDLEARKQFAAEHLNMKLEETRQKMESAMKQLGGGKLPEHDHGMDWAFALEFNSDETQLFVGTHRGCLVFDWSDVRASANPQPRTIIEPRSSEDRNNANYVYSLAFDAARNLLLIGSIAKLHYYDPTSGKSGVLLTPPAPASFLKLCLSPDHSALACVCVGTPNRENLNDRPPPELQIWNYPALLKEAGLA